MLLTQFKIAALYCFLIAGGVWHLLGVLQPLMRLTAAPVIMGLAIWVFVEWRRTRPEDRRKVDSWAALVIMISFCIEWLGVRSGVIFGEYAYGDTLQPQLATVPVAIGFAWLVMLLGSAAVWQRIVAFLPSHRSWISAAGIALLMTIFDAVLEPAAIRLEYWSWSGDSVPLQNYAAWFVISLGFAALAQRWRLFNTPLPAIAFHAYWAQLAYFTLVHFS